MSDTPAGADHLDLRRELQPFAHMGRAGLLPALQMAQRLHGWLSEPVAAAVATELHVPLADVHGVIEFYTLLRNKPVGSRVISVCADIACALRDGDGVLHHLCQNHRLEPGETSRDGSITIEPSPCLGLCEQAPAALVNDQAETSIDLTNNHYELGRPRSIVGGPLRLLTANCGHGTTSLDSHGEYAALKKAVTMTPAAVVDEIKASGLVGRGGAAFPTGIKWEGAAAAPGSPKYIVCNADESEPGTFKDRVLLLDDPHTLIEGMAIAGHAVGAERGYIYLRGEYAYILPALEAALIEARDAHLLGSEILGTSISFDIEIRLGSGAYICGEETALFESIEGKRGFPRVKPPFPTTYGLFGKPTVINNVETLFNVPLIILRGAAEYRRIGTEKSPGPKLFCVSGDVERPGVYEIPFGHTLGELLEMAGGIGNGRALQAVLFGGAAGAFATSAQLDVKLTFEDLRAAGLPLGSGVVMVFDERRDLRDTLARLGQFFAHESCGKCYPCQLGTQRQKEVLDRVAAGTTLDGDLERLQDVGWTMTDASLCGLGQTAASAVLSAIKLWPGVFEAKAPSATARHPLDVKSSGHGGRSATKAAKTTRGTKPARKKLATKRPAGKSTKGGSGRSRQSESAKRPPRRGR
ncbi:MAG TPA: NAD(P)H-dependent oxidoreductase subunit E [Anaerolineales bacterium]